MNRITVTLTALAISVGTVLTAAPVEAFPTGGFCIPIDTDRTTRYETRVGMGFTIHRSRHIIRRTVRCDHAVTVRVTRSPWVTTMETTPIVGNGNTR